MMTFSIGSHRRGARIVALVAALAALLGLGAAPVSASTPRATRIQTLTAYSHGRLGAGWEDATWALHRFVSSPARGVTGRVMSVDLASFAGVYLRYRPAVVGGARSVELRLDGGILGGQNLAVAIVDDRNHFGVHIPLAPYLPSGNLPAGRWTVVRVPVAGSLLPGARIGGVALQEWGGHTEPTLYIASVTLTVEAPR